MNTSYLITTPVFLNNWSSLEDMKKDFWPDYSWREDEDQKYKNELEGVNILLATYGTPAYEGHAFVLFERDGKLYEVNGSHCSCYGLEGQWDPEETTVESLRHRLDKGDLGAGSYDDNPFAAELRQVLEQRA